MSVKNINYDYGFKASIPQPYEKVFYGFVVILHMSETLLRTYESVFSLLPWEILPESFVRHAKIITKEA